MKKIISKVFTILLIVFFVLLGFSYIDTITHNDPTNENYGDYSKMNIIVQLYEWVVLKRKEVFYYEKFIF